MKLSINTKGTSLAKIFEFSEERSKELINILKSHTKELYELAATLDDDGEQAYPIIVQKLCASTEDDKEVAYLLISFSEYMGTVKSQQSRGGNAIERLLEQLSKQD